MKVLFAVPSTQFSKKINLVRVAKQVISEAGHIICLDNDDPTMIESLGKQNDLDEEDWKVLANREIAAADECDVAILDVTNKATFGIGYMAALVLQAKKPTLFLLEEGSLNGSFINGLQGSQLYRAYYNDINFKAVIERFLSQAEELK